MPEIAGLYVRDLGAGPARRRAPSRPGARRLRVPARREPARGGRPPRAAGRPAGQRPLPDGDRAEWSLAGYARAVQRLADALELRDWTLLGHSFGGYVALQHLVDHPGTAARLIASCTDADEDPPEGMPEPPEPEGAVREAFEREATVATPEECREAWLGQLPFFTPDPERVAGMLRDVVFRPDVHHPRDWGELHALGALAAADIPVLSIGAGRDPSAPIALAERIANAAPRGTLVRLADAGHFPFAEDPRLLGRIARWLGETAHLRPGRPPGPRTAGSGQPERRAASSALPCSAPLRLSPCARRKNSASSVSPSLSASCAYCSIRSALLRHCSVNQMML